MISSCSSLSTSFLKSESGSRIDEGCDALFLSLFSVVRVIIKIAVIFVVLLSWVLSEYAFRTNVSTLTAS